MVPLFVYYSRYLSLRIKKRIPVLSKEDAYSCYSILNGQLWSFLSERMVWLRTRKEIREDGGVEVKKVDFFIVK